MESGKGVISHMKHMIYHEQVQHTGPAGAMVLIRRQRVENINKTSPKVDVVWEPTPHSS